MRKKRNFIIFFLCLIFMCMLAFLVLDIFYPQDRIISNVLKYATVWLSFSLTMKGTNNKFKLAQGLTLLCDYLLLFTSFYTLGVILFSSVQLVYILSFLEQKKKMDCLYGLIHPLLIISGFCYALLLISNLFFSAAFYFKRKREIDFLLFCAFGLFALCDLSILFYQVFDISFFGWLIWLFYTPSQVLIAITNTYFFTQSDQTSAKTTSRS